MPLDGLQFLMAFVVFLAALLVAGRGARRVWPAIRNRPKRFRPLVDATEPEEIPDDSSPSRDDD